MHYSTACRRTSSTFSTRNIVLSGMFAAVLSIISQLSIPMPSGVPITIQLFGIALVGCVLGWKLGLFSTLIYIVLGSAGLPVFAGFQGGLHVLTGFTGGYIWTWPVMALLCGIPIKSGKRILDLSLSIFLTVIGVLVVEFTGGLWWSYLSGDQSLKAIMLYSFTAFIPKDIIISIAGLLIGKRMKNAGL